MTLREDAQRAVAGAIYDGWSEDTVLDAIAALLEATGAPAYMRVAADLRGEWEPDASQPVTP